MIRILFLIISILFGRFIREASAQVKDFAPVTKEMLLNPSPDDWLMLSRTYDEQRFSPLDQINRQNVGQLRMAWVRGMPPGGIETIPTVYRGVLYVLNPGSIIQALDATNGDLIWEYRRKLPDDLKNYVGTVTKSKSLSIYQDLLYYDTPDGYLLALDARTGAVRWETKVQEYKEITQHTSASIVVDGRVITGRSCVTRAGCFIAAHDALTGKELWRFYTTAAAGQPGGDTWGSVPTEGRVASPWGLPGSYDPLRKLIYWGVANANPYTRLKRHNGNPDEISRSSPADLYSDSTVALDPENGKLAWYFQELPGDDWDLDHTHERVLIRTPFNPDPRAVKWINPRIPRGQERDVTVEVAEAGGIWVLDRANGQFLWATPFPYDVPEFHISRIDVETGKTYINWDLVFKKDGDRHIVCYQNTKGYFPMAYDPRKNSIYVPYNDFCLDMTANMKSPEGWGPRTAIPRPGSDPNALGGVAKVDMATGQVAWRYTQHFPGQGAVVATAGDLIFWGDLNRRFKALDSDTGKVLWEVPLGSSIENSTITYAVNGKQYVAVLTGEGMITGGLFAKVPDMKPPRGHNAIYVFALP